MGFLLYKKEDVMKNRKLMGIVIACTLAMQINAQPAEHSAHYGAYDFDLEMANEFDEIYEVRHGETGGF